MPDEQPHTLLATSRGVDTRQIEEAAVHDSSKAGKIEFFMQQVCPDNTNRPGGSCTHTVLIV